MRTRSMVATAIAVLGLTGAPGRGEEPPNPYGEMLHVGIVVRDLDKAVAQWRAIGFKDIRILPASKGVDRTYRGKPIDVALKQAFIAGTKPAVELMQPVGDAPNPWGDYLK